MAMKCIIFVVNITSLFFIILTDFNLHFYIIQCTRTVNVDMLLSKL